MLQVSLPFLLFVSLDFYILILTWQVHFMSNPDPMSTSETMEAQNDLNKITLYPGVIIMLCAASIRDARLWYNGFVLLPMTQ